MAVVKILELVGESRKDWQDAVQAAVREAAKTVDNITGVEVTNFTAHVEQGNIVGYKADVKVAFRVNENR